MLEVQWRVLSPDEWPKLVEFLKINATVNLEVPDPALSTVLVLETPDNTILAAIPCTLQPVIGAAAVHPDCPAELVDMVYASGVQALRTVMSNEGITDVPIYTFNDPAKVELLGEVGFTELLDTRVYVGVPVD